MDCISCRTPLPVDARFCMTCGLDVTDPAATVQTRRRDPAAELLDRLTRTLAGRYAVKKLLGQGGMAAVFLADELGLDRPVAIKVLPPELSRDEGLVARFEREARTAARLDHPHIIPIHRVESEAGLHYFVMKYVPGRSLDDLLDRPEPIALDTTIRILREAAAALGHAHARGVVHRDVKPANIMLDQDDRVVLTDFGISKAGESTHLTQTGMIVGTPHYMAPEQALGGEVDGRADQYALGVVAYQMLTRQCPFEGDSAHTIIYKHIHESPRPVAVLRPELPPHVADAVATALAKHPAQRFATMEDFARALGGDTTVITAAREKAAKPTLLAHPTPSRVATVIMNGASTSPIPRPVRGRRRMLAGAGVALAVVAIAAALWLGGSPASRATPPLLAGDASRGDPLPSPSRAADSANPGPSSAAAAGTDSSARATQPSPAAPGRGTQPPRRQNPAAERKAAAQDPAKPEPVRTAPFTVASEPYGELYIDDVLIGDTPVSNHPLQVGRTYQVRIEREGYRTWRETIVVRDPNSIRRRPQLVPAGGDR